MNSIVKRALRNGLILGLFVCLAWSVIACGNGDVQRPEPDQDATIVAAAVKTTLEAIATAEAAEAPTATSAPAPQPSPTPSAAPIVSPTQAPTQEVGSAGTDGGDSGSTEPLAPLATKDAGAFLSDVSDSERMCLSDNIPSDRMAMLATTPELATEAEREAFLGCLEHNTGLGCC